MENRIRPEYRGKCIGYLLRIKDSQKPEENVYAIAVSSNSAETVELFSNILVCSEVEIIRILKDIKNLKSDEKFMDSWYSVNSKSDRQAIEALEKLILQN